MTDYTKSVDFAAKDLLSSGDPSKIIKGTEFGTEFDNIEAAILTKANIAGPTFTGTTTIPTVDINGGAIDAVTLGINSAITQAQIDNININGNTISSSDTNGNVNISPNGTGTVVINTDLDVDNINVNGNTVSSTDTNGNINLSPNGTGSVVINTDLDVDNININGNAIISTDTNGNIDLTPNGTGEVNISKVDINSGAIDGTVIGAASAAAITGTTITGTSFVTSGDMTFGDNDKAVFGAGSDLQIYHDATDSIINDNGTGSLKLQQGGSTKLEVTSTGVDVTGTVTTDGLTVDGDVFVSTSSSTTDGTDGAFVDIKNTDTTTSVVSGVRFLNGTTTAFKGAVFFEDLAGDGRGDVVIASNDVASGSAAVGLADQRLRVSRSGDISFYEDTGTTPKFVWKAADERLGIGTTSPSQPLHVYHPTTNGVATFQSGDANVNISLMDSATTAANYVGIGAVGNDLTFISGNGSERMRIDSSGNVGIGTASPPEGFAIGATSSVAGFSIGSGDTQVFLRYNNYFSGTAQVSDATKGTASISLGRGSDGIITFNTAAAGAGVPAEAMRIDADGKIGIGTTSPNTLVHLSDAGPVLAIGSTSASDPRIDFYDQSATTIAASLFFDQDADTLKILRTASGSATDGILIDSSGHAIIPTGVTLGTSGTYNAANTLDDYEEGTFTPSFSNVSYTATSAAGRYTKIGSLVYCSIAIVTSVMDNTDTSSVSVNLPFSGINQAGTGSLSSRFGATSLINSTTSGLVVGVTVEGSSVYLTRDTDSNYAKYSQIFNASGEFYLSLIYEAA